MAKLGALQAITRILLALCLFAAPLPAVSAPSPQDVEDEGPYSDLIHADVPLWSDETEDLWPKHFYEGTSFGCIYPMELGDWRFRETGATPEDDVWYRFAGYGVMHCWINLSWGRALNDLGQIQPTFLIKIGAVGDRELWVLQIGALPGSDYVLLSRQAGRYGIKQFDVLQRQCPPGHQRGGVSLDILLTDYCAINARGELVDLARRMAALPPLGTLTYVRPSPEEDE